MMIAAHKKRALAARARKAHAGKAPPDRLAYSSQLMFFPNSGGRFWYPRCMYVQWVSRNRDHKGGGVLIAQLVESKRVNGKSRKFYLAHLGTCRESVDTLRHRFWFYEHCDQVLDRLALAPEDRTKVDALLAARIRPPSDAQ